MRMVLVTWLDTNENSVGGWIEKDDLDKSEVCSVDSLGWLYKENDELIVFENKYGSQEVQHRPDEIFSFGYPHIKPNKTANAGLSSNYKFEGDWKTILCGEY